MKCISEKPFEQKFDVILYMERLTLDIEKDIYPGEKVGFYLNGSTGNMGNSLESVIREGIPYNKMPYDEWHKDQVYYCVEYSKKLKAIIFHLVYTKSGKGLYQGEKFGYGEFGRFIVYKDGRVLVKSDGVSISSPHFYLGESYKKFVPNGLYTEGYAPYDLPITKKGTEFLKERIMDYWTGEKGSRGFIKEISNMFPIFFNTTGNNYTPMDSYENMYDYFSMLEKGTCAKKAGKKQDYIDKMVAVPLPDIKKEIRKVNPLCKKIAIINRVEWDGEPTCCIRTCHILDDVIFEGGRIYVTKKNAEFCKKNIMGEYVAQPFLQKAEHWDFEIEEFDEAVCKDTMLEYFSEIIQQINTDCRAIAIWMFLSNPVVESIAKETSIEFINSTVRLVRDSNDLSRALEENLLLEKGENKMLKALGLNKQQFLEIKEYLPYIISEFDVIDNIYSMGLLHFLKKFLLIGTGHVDYSDELKINKIIPSIDLETFKKYLRCSFDMFALLTADIYCGRSIRDVQEEILQEIKNTKVTFPNFNMENMFGVLCLLMNDYMKCHYNGWHNEYRTMYRDYLNMVNSIANVDKNDFQPKFKSLEDVKNMHDNLIIMDAFQKDAYEQSAFNARHGLWEKWEYTQKPKKENGEVKDGTFIVKAPQKPIELAVEGTILHHCVKNYIERVKDGQTNIMFIRLAEDPQKPFFTVEVSNDKFIEQVHGFSNCNADTYPGLEEFIREWARARHLKNHEYNKVR